MADKNLLRSINTNTSGLFQKLKQRPVLIVILLMIAYAAYFSYYTILKHQTFHSYAYDLGIFMQYMWTTLHGHGIFHTSFPLEISGLGWHFQPILFFILPLYAIFPHAETLLVLQTLFLALGALPVYLIARDELGAKVGVAFAGLYLLFPALHGINSFDFHAVTLAVPMLLFCFYMFKKKHYKWGMILAVLAMMCKENVPLVLIFMGFYWLWMERKRGTGGLDWRRLPKEREVLYPLFLSVLGVIWFVLAVNVIVPHFSLTGGYPWWLDRFGYGNIFGNLLVDINAKLWYLFHLFGPLLFTSLLNPPTLLIGLPILAQSLFATRETMYSIVFQYSSTLIPWLFIASIYGIKWLSTVQGKSIQAISSRFLYILLPMTVVMALLVSPSPIALDQNMPQLTSHHTTVQKAISLIPDDASVYTQENLFTHICHRRHVYAHPVDPTKPRPDLFEFYGGNYDYILVDSTSEKSILTWSSKKSLERLESEYGIYAQGDGVYLYKRGYEGKPILLGQE